MSNLYSRIEALCKQKDINVTTMCRETGVTRGNLTDLKMGRTSSLSARNLDKISSYFGVSIEYLLNGEQKENAPADPGKDVSDEDIKAAFFNGADPSLTKEDRDAMWQDAQEYFRFKIAQRRKQQEDGK